jgi:hypothetical protein
MKEGFLPIAIGEIGILFQISIFFRIHKLNMFQIKFEI